MRAALANLDTKATLYRPLPDTLLTRAPGSVASSNSHFANLLHRAAVGSLPNGPAPHRPSAAPFLRMEASMFKNGSGIEFKNGSGIEPSDIANGQIVPQEASAAATFEEQLDRHANITPGLGSDWADGRVEEADRLVEEAEAKRRAAIEFAEEIRRRAAENAADLKAGFERIRAAGRALQEARRQFDLGRVS